jgi:hypothetical protein
MITKTALRISSIAVVLVVLISLLILILLVVLVVLVVLVILILQDCREPNRPQLMEPCFRKPTRNGADSKTEPRWFLQKPHAKLNRGTPNRRRRIHRTGQTEPSRAETPNRTEWKKRRTEPNRRKFIGWKTKLKNEFKIKLKHQFKH